MVTINPIWIIVVMLAAAFMIGLRRGTSSYISIAAAMGAIGFAAVVSAGWLVRFFLISGADAAATFTAGFAPPLSIMLRMGPEEAFGTLLINLLGMLSGLFMLDALHRRARGVLMVYLALMAGLNGLVLTTDLFNLFVFLEIAAIALAGLVILGRDPHAVSSGFKYLMAGGLVTGTLLLGIVFLYHLGGSLSIPHLADAGLSAFRGGIVALFLVVISLVLELKPFPANGWALDLYTSVHPGMAALISGAYSTAVLFALDHILVLWGGDARNLVLALGLVTFVGSNLAAMVQERDRRLLGYSSIAQLGLLMTVVGLRPELGTDYPLIAAGLLLSHALAKSLLFWLSGLVESRNLDAWGIFSRRPFLLMIMGTAVLMLTGFPPFPAFFSKWLLISRLTSQGGMIVASMIVVGSMLEGVYLFRWLGSAAKGGEEAAVEGEFHYPHWHQWVPLSLLTVAAYAAGLVAAWLLPEFNKAFLLPLGFAGLLFLVDSLPAWFKNTLVIVTMGGLAVHIMPELEGIRFVFAVIFILGGIVTLLAGYAWRGPRKGFYPQAVLMFAGMVMLLSAATAMEFFFGWEVMTVGSYFLILRGKRSLRHAFHYMLFSLGGALLMLVGFGMAQAAAGDSALSAFPAAMGSSSGIWIFILLTLGFLSKTATLPLHIWLPGAHAEAETDVSPMVSAILLKAGVFGMMLLLLWWKTSPAGVDEGAAVFLSWLGAVTALLGNIMASFQEDAKRLLAYSSIAQLGYILFALSFMNHLGWLSAMTFSINHMIFKALLFLAIGGVVWRVKTREMYRMGGLISRMPISFLSVLIGIITVSGVPPLSGFAGKWIIFNAIVLKGWFLQGAIVLLAGMVAFLYCFRLIHAIFLGIPKDRFRKVREAPFWILLPQVILMGAIMAFSMVPNMILRPVGRVLSVMFPADALDWQGSRALSALGYWDGTMIMYISGGVFVMVLLWMTATLRRSQKVKAFNMVYAGERPYRPETTHFAHNFYAPFRKALGFLVTPLAIRFWQGVSDSVLAVSDFGRRIYSGNGQVYVLHMVLYLLAAFVLWAGVVS